MDDPQYKHDGSQIRIWAEPAPSPAASERAGRPLFDDVIYIEVISPGQSGSSPVFEVERTFNEEIGLPPMKGPNYEKYSGIIEAFKSGDTGYGATGTPLAEWPAMSRSMAASLKASGIHTVDALSTLADTHLTLIGPGGREWRTKAQAFLASAEDSGASAKYAADLQRERDLNAKLQGDLAAMNAKLEALIAGQSGDASAGTVEPGPVTTAANTPPSPAAEAAPGDTLVAAKAPASII